MIPVGSPGILAVLYPSCTRSLCLTNPLPLAMGHLLRNVLQSAGPALLGWLLLELLRVPRLKVRFGLTTLLLSRHWGIVPEVRQAHGRLVRLVWLEPTNTLPGTLGLTE